MWCGVLGGPIAWLVQLQANYALVPWVCRHGGRWALTAMSVIFLFLSLAAMGVCLAFWRRPRTREKDIAGAVVAERCRFLARLGMWTGALFFLVILAQGIATMIFNPCSQ